MQECRHCLETLEDAAFSVNRARENGLSIYCRNCTKIMAVERGDRKPEGWIRKTADIKAYNREYDRRRRLADPEKARVKARENYVRKMKRLHGESWTPGRPRKTEAEKLAAKRKKAAKAQAARTKRCREDPEERQKYNARKSFRKAVARGAVVAWPCEVCGEKAEAHHPTYDRPMLVTWLCPTHHREAHRLTATLKA